MIRKTILAAVFLMGIVTGVVSIVTRSRPIDYWTKSEPFWGVYVWDFGAAVMHFELDARVDDLPLRAFAFREWQVRHQDPWDTHGWFMGWQFEWRKRGTTRLGGPAVQTIGTWIYVPLWLLAILLLGYPTLAFIRGPLRRRRRRKRGLCIHCGYNLTGLTEPRCPECGGAV